MIGLLIVVLAGCGGPDAPPDMVRITGEEAFWIDPYEFPNEPGTKPLTYTDLGEAQEACASRGKRLCTAAEWRRACAGPNGANRFAHGPTWEVGRCHTEERLPSGHTSIMDPDALVKPAGTFADCVTPEGVHDLIGSLEEWVVDDYGGRRASLEGGAWYTHRRYADCSGRYSRQPDYRVNPDREVFSAGVRCCWTPTAPSDDDVAADAHDRLQAAAAKAGGRPYDPAPEIALGDGVFMDTYEYPNVPGAWPRVAVTWTEARDACSAAGKRLCSTREWEQACAGEANRDYPYGHRYVVGACATERSGPVPAGTFPRCVADSGAADLVGSAWEWTATPLHAPVLSEVPLREVRGGSWFSDDVKGTCRPTDGYPAARPDQPWEDVGFRCCRGPEATPDPAPARGTGTCPDGMVALPGVCVDAYEHPNAYFHKPQASLTFAQAQAACTAAGKRMCTGAEWTRACAGASDRRWPYGDVFDGEACHDGAMVQRQGGQVVRSGELRGCRTPEGVFDLSGNLWEWTAEPTRGGGTRGVLRGGGWNLSAGLGQCRARAVPATGYASPEAGVRCCADPQ